MVSGGGSRTRRGARYVRALEERRPLSDLQKLKLAVDNAGERGLTRTDIHGKEFHSMRTKDEIDALLGQLAAGYPGEYRTWEVPTIGSPAVYVGPWFDRPGPDGQRRRFPDPPGARYVQPLGDPVSATRREADLRRLKLAIDNKKQLGISRTIYRWRGVQKRAYRGLYLWVAGRAREEASWCLPALGIPPHR